MSSSRFLVVLIRRALSVLAVACTLLSVSGRAEAEESKVKVATQFGLAYLPLIVMEHDRLWEKQAAALGHMLTVDYVRLGGGGALNDALISDSVDVVAGGTAPMLVLWDRTTTSFKVRGLAALCAAPIDILTNKPGIKSLADFRSEDRIAVPSIRVSLQAIVLMAASEREFGPGQTNRLDNLTVAMQHPDALAALSVRGGPISAYVSSSPYQEIALKKPGITKITDSFKAFGGPSTLSVVYAKEVFVNKNPKVTAAFYAALHEALASIARDPSAAIDTYLAVTRERTDRALLQEIMARPDFRFGVEPKATLALAQLMQRVGLLKQKPVSWKEFFAEPLHVGHGS
ncbi:MAG: ABC transporter substrate-binding protein [Pseudorhodoplanes sp.]|nr:ABC transporter substrate-binding protein [Pseudorhodoplanes sp.]